MKKIFLCFVVIFLCSVGVLVLSINQRSQNSDPNRVVVINGETLMVGMKYRYEDVQFTVTKIFDPGILLLNSGVIEIEYTDEFISPDTANQQVCSKLEDTAYTSIIRPGFYLKTNSCDGGIKYTFSNFKKIDGIVHITLEYKSYGGGLQPF